MSELELFLRLSELSKFREYLQSRLDEDVEVLIHNPSEHVLRQAQGRAQAWRTLLEALDRAKQARK